MTWTRERPTQEGVYRWRLNEDDPCPVSVEVWHSPVPGVGLIASTVSHAFDIYKGEWEGPIPEPEEGAVGG